jgi:hypothetical protein
VFWREITEVNVFNGSVGERGITSMLRHVPAPDNLSDCLIVQGWSIVVLTWQKDPTNELHRLLTFVLVCDDLICIVIVTFMGSYVNWV